MIPSLADEAPHAPGPERGWSEVWQLDAATRDGVGLTVRLECFPNEKVAWFWTYLVLPAWSGPVVVRDHEVALPRQGLEIRAEGLWAELCCETPMEHWTYGLEAFAVALDDAADAMTGEIGERMALGLDLEWEIDGEVHATVDDWPVAGYAVPGIVHGEVLFGRERLEFDASGEHQRRWGARDLHASIGDWSISCAGAAVAMHVDGLADGRVDGYVEWSDAPRQRVSRGRREGSSHATRWILDDELEITAEVLTGAPVPAGVEVVDRALCRFQIDDAVDNGWSSVVEAR